MVEIELLISHIPSERERRHCRRGSASKRALLKVEPARGLIVGIVLLDTVLNDPSLTKPTVRTGTELVTDATVALLARAMAKST